MQNYVCGSQCISVGIAARDYIANIETDRQCYWLGNMEKQIYFFQFQNLPSNIYT